MRRTILLMATMLAVAGLAAAAPQAGASSAPVRLTFDKSAVSTGIWQGTLAGDVTGSLTTVLTELRIAGPVWHVRFDWIVNAGGSSFVADLHGTLNIETGAVVMNGTVVDGLLEGAQVHERGRLVDPAALRFQGSIRLMPASAG